MDLSCRVTLLTRARTGIGSLFVRCNLELATVLLCCRCTMGKKSRRTKQKAPPTAAASTAAAAAAAAAPSSAASGASEDRLNEEFAARKKELDEILERKKKLVGLKEALDGARSQQSAAKSGAAGGKKSGSKASGSSPIIGNHGIDMANLLSRVGLSHRNPFVATTAAETDAIRTPPIASNDDRDPVKAVDEATCWLCLEGPSDGNAEALRRNCACRGSDGYVHLSCYANYAKSVSEDIWCGNRKAAPNRDWLAFGVPWESCPNCKQYFCGRWRHDIALEYARSTEGMVGGIRMFRHVNAYSWVTKSLLNSDVYPSLYEQNYEKVEAEFEKLLDLITQAHPIYCDDDNGMNFAMQYLYATLQQLEAESYVNYAHAASFKLIMLNNINNTTITKEQTALYQKWEMLMDRASKTIDVLLTSKLGQRMSGQLDMMKLNIQSQCTHFRNQCAHLNAKPRKEDVKQSSQSETEALKLSEELMNFHIKQTGESSTDAIRFSLQHVQTMMMSSEDWRPFEALELLLKTHQTSTLSLGPSHDLTAKVRGTLQSLITHNRAVANVLDPTRAFCPVISYEKDCDIYIVDTMELHRKGMRAIDGDIGEETGWDVSEVVLKTGAFVKCEGLKNAQHLNGKRGWVHSYDEEKERHLVKFEDKDTKSCLVKPGNLRLLFFDVEDELAADCAKKTGVDGAQEDSDKDSNREEDLPDLL